MAKSNEEMFPYLSKEYQEKMSGLSQEKLKKSNESMKARAKKEMQDFVLHQHLNIVLFGKTGTGKSTLGNLLLDQEKFAVSNEASSCTETIRVGETTFEECKLKIIDTPGFGNTESNKEVLYCEILKVMETFRDGIDIYVFVFNLADPRFTPEQMEAFEGLKGQLGDHILKRSVAILTNAKHLTDKNTTLEDYIEGIRDTPFGKLLVEVFHSRVIAVECVAMTKICIKEQRERIIRKLKTMSPSFGRDSIMNSQDMVLPKLDRALKPYRKIIREAVLEKLRKLKRNEIEKADKHNIAKEICDDIEEKDIEGLHSIPKIKVREAVDKILASQISRMCDPSILDRIKGLPSTLITFTSAFFGRVKPQGRVERSGSNTAPLHTQGTAERRGERTGGAGRESVKRTAEGRGNATVEGPGEETEEEIGIETTR